LGAMLDEPIEVVPYRAAWATIAADEIACLSAALGSLALALEHFGSTSVPGCAAKPIIDILVGVREWPPAPAVTSTLEELGYENCGEAGVVNRLYLRGRCVRGFDFNLAVTLYEGPLWRKNILVRDFLRSEPWLVTDHVHEKQAALRAGCNTLLSYSEHKATFMKRLVERALAWSAGR
jgi:GrpB-like predicted nucleotidyltransferase (UPF0157 family)